ncbi:MAG: haloalkane dehalogenase [Pseudomonadota bacterium]|nr:haloalkane dehalogenase [Pseudomonadota bacterium]
MGFADYPFTSRYLTVDGHRLHYIDEGRGPTLLFLHGNPTSSYLWRNVIKPLTAHYRCVALDLIGFGKSDKPDLDYRFLTHYHFLHEFVGALELSDITLVLHDWGGPLGFRLAQHQPERVSALCFMETFPFTFDWHEFPPAARPLFFAFRQRRLSYWLLQRQNRFVDVVLRFSTRRRLPRSVLAAYRAPFPDARSRYPIRVFPGELPINDRRTETWAAIQDIEQRLERMPQPMLLLQFHPGAVLSRTRVAWLSQRIPHLDVVDCGRGLHYVQEDNPDAIASALADWCRQRTPSAATGAPVVAVEDKTFSGTLHWAFALARPADRDEGLVAAWSDRGLVMLSFADDADDGQRQVSERFPACRLERTDDARIAGLFTASGHTPLHLIGTDFQRRVWRALLEVPAGTTSDYAALAARVGSQARAVGGAVAANRIAVLVPCHRVVPRAGGAGAYHWGQDRKRALLAAEGAAP